MTQNAAFKQEVRARMAATGEKYTKVRREILAERERESADREGEAGADKAAGLYERYDTDDAFLASLKSPDASSGEKLPNLEFDGRRWIERTPNS